MYGYLGSFATLDDLQARYPAPRLNSYAFVAEKIYKYTASGWAVAYETGGEATSNFRDYVMLASGSNPLSGNLRMFAKTIKRMFTRDSSGVEAMVCDDSGWQPEYPGLVCDGLDDYISIADNANLNFPGTPFMQEFFIKLSSDVTTVQTIFYKGTNGFRVYIEAGFLKINKYGIGDWGNVSVTQYAGRLLHGLAGWDGTNKVIYLNGQLVLSSAQSTNLIETTTSVQLLGSTGAGSFFKGSIYLARFWNLALTATEVLQLYNNGQPQNSVILSKYRGASQVNKVVNGTFDTDTNWAKGLSWAIGGGIASYDAVNNLTYVSPLNGNLIPYKSYKLLFTVSSTARLLITNTTGGTTLITTTNYSPGTYTLYFISIDNNFRIYARNDGGGGAFNLDNVECYQLGTVLELKGENMGHVSAIDTSGNRLHGAMNGTPALTVNPLQQKATTGIFTTNIASGTANKDIIIPAGYYVTAITVANTLSAGNLTNIQAVLDPTGDNITLVSGKTVNNAKTLTFTALADQTQYTSSRVVRVNATGNGTGGMEVMLILARRD